MNHLRFVVLILLLTAKIEAQSQKQPDMEIWDYQYDVQEIMVSDSLRVGYIDEGNASGPVLLFIHGLGSNLQAWRKNINFLKSNYRCVALDLPGYGKSKKGDYPFDMTFFGKVLESFIKTLKLDAVTLVGHSMGGQIAMHAVLQGTEGVEKLILIAPAGLEVFSEQEKAWFKRVYTPAAIKATSVPQIEKNFKLNFYTMPDDARFMIDDRLLMRQSNEYDHYCRMIPQCVAGMLNEPVFERLPEILLPTLIVFGENDALIPNKLLHPALTVHEVAKSGNERLPQSRLIMFSSAGHFVQWEQAQWVNEAISTFLKP